MKNNNDFYIQQLEEDLGDLKDYIEEFLLFLPIPVCSVNPLGIIVDMNKMFYELIGYEKGEQIKGETILGANHLFKDKKKWKKIEKKILNKDEVEREEIIVLTKKGEEIPVNIYVSCRESSDGDLIGYFLAFIDISEIKKLQEGLEDEVIARTSELQKRVEEL